MAPLHFPTTLLTLTGMTFFILEHYHSYFSETLATLRHIAVVLHPVYRIQALVKYLPTRVRNGATAIRAIKSPV